MKNTLQVLLLAFITSFSSFSSAQVADEAMTLKVAIIPHRSTLGNETAYARLFEEMTKETGIQFEWVGSKTYDDVIENITIGEADIGYVGPFSYVDAQDNHGVRLICRTLSKKKKEFYHSMITTRKDSGINSIADLKGKSFAFTDKKSTSGYLFPMTFLKTQGFKETDFSSVKFLKRHANSLLAVYKGHVDAGATSYTAIDKVNIDFEEVKILWKSKPIYRGPWIAKKTMSDPLFQKVQSAMLKISNAANADEVFDGLTTKGFILGKDSDYDNVRDVIKLMQN